MTSRQFRDWMQRTGFPPNDVAIATGMTVGRINTFARVDGKTAKQPPTYMRLVCIGLVTEREIRRQNKQRNEQR